MTPVQTLYRWFNDNPEATYKEALEAYEHCLELEQQLPQQEISDEEVVKLLQDMNKQPMRFHCVPKEISDEEIEKAAKEYYEENIDNSNIPREHYELEIQELMVGFCARWYREQLKQRQ
jgi:NifU-like protein involved in Fe-S cluster formation